MFHTDSETAHIEKIANYTDPKGEKADGLQIDVSMSMDPSALDMFAPGLRESFYRTHDVISAQNAGGGVKPGMVVRRFDLFDRIACGQKVVGADVVIHKVDLLGAADVRMIDATIDRIKVKLLKGGIEIRMRVLARPDGAGIARLFEARKGTVTISITPPEAAEYEPDDDDDEDAASDDQADMLEEHAAGDDPIDARGPLDDDFAGDDPNDIPVTEPKRGRKPAAKKPGKKPAATKRTARAFPAALDGTGDRDPFEAPAGSALQ